MSLYLRILEEETAATLDAQPRLFEGARLPYLSKNIRAGNSLIEDANVPVSLLEDLDLRRRINPFDWRDTERGFGNVFKTNGGFDIVIGNPPYTQIQALRKSLPEETKIMAKEYKAATAGFDIASLFVERGLQLLAPASRRNRAGRLIFITSRTFTETDAGLGIREILSAGQHVAEIVDFGSGRVFAEAGAYTVILTVSSKKNTTWRLTRVPEPPTTATLSAALRDPVLSAEVSSRSLTPEPWSLSLPAEDDLLRRLASAGPTLGEVSGNSIFQGVITGHDGVFRAVDVGIDPTDPNRRLVRPNSAPPGSTPLAFERWILRPVFAGKADFRPFHTAISSEWLILPYGPTSESASFTLLPWQTIQQDAPEVAKWLAQNKEDLRKRAGTWTANNWFSYSRRQNLERFSGSKIMVPSMLDRLCATHDQMGHFFVNVSTGGYGISNDPTYGADPEYVAALLNSTLLSWVLKRYSRAWRGGWFEARKGNLERLPIAIPKPDRQVEVIALYRQVQTAVAEAIRLPDDHDTVRMAATAKATFDHAVFTLYRLTLNETHLVTAV